METLLFAKLTAKKLKRGGETAAKSPCSRHSKRNAANGGHCQSVHWFTQLIANVQSCILIMTTQKKTRQSQGMCFEKQRSMKTANMAAGHVSACNPYPETFKLTSEWTSASKLDIWRLQKRSSCIECRTGIFWRKKKRHWIPKRSERKMTNAEIVAPEEVGSTKWYACNSSLSRPEEDMAAAKMRSEAGY